MNSSSKEAPKRMTRAMAYEVPKSDGLSNFAIRLSREAGVEDLKIVQENGGWILKQGENELTCVYTKTEAIACIAGYVAGLRTASTC